MVAETNQDLLLIRLTLLIFLEICFYPIEIFKKAISQSKSIMWNGPMGIAEVEEFSHGTKTIATLIVRATNLGTYSLIGGGDTVSDVARFGLKQQFSYVSTGGGAMLEFFKNNYLEPTKDLLKINNEDY